VHEGKQSAGRDNGVGGLGVLPKVGKELGARYSIIQTLAAISFPLVSKPPSGYSAGGFRRLMSREERPIITPCQRERVGIDPLD